MWECLVLSDLHTRETVNNDSTPEPSMGYSQNEIWPHVTQLYEIMKLQCKDKVIFVVMSYWDKD